MTNERVRLPRKLSKSVSGRVLAEVGRLHPVGALGITLNMLPLNRVTMTLPEDDLPLLMHDLVEVYNQNGSVGVYRVTKITNTHRKNRRVELSHGLDVFSDATFTMSEHFTGTVATFLQKVINSQTQTIGGTKYWRLGTCADTNTWNKDIKFDNLMECLTEIAKTEEDYMFTFDQSTFPWTLNFVAKDSAVLSEFRLSRNVENCQVTLDDSDMCNRLLLSVDTTTTSDEGDTTTTTHETHNDTASQAVWGVIIKTAGIKAEDVPDKAAWVSQYFARHGQPGVQISIDGWELNRLTGETLDEVHLARICRVALPDYDTVFNERVVSVSYPDALRNPKHVNVSLANKRQKAEGAFSDISSQASRAASAARDNSKKIQNNQTSNAREYNTIVARVETTEGDIRTIEGTGVFQNSERITQVAGKFTVDSQGNVHVINGSNLYLDDNTGSFAVYTNGNLTAGAIIQKINGTSQSGSILANKLDVNATDVAAWGAYTNNTLTGGILVQKINDGSTTTQILGSRVDVRATDLATWGVYTDNTLTAGIIVNKINGGTVQIAASKVDLGNYATVNQLEAVKGDITKLTTAQTTATSMRTLGLTVDNDLSLLGYTVDWSLCSIGSKTFNYLAPPGQAPTITYADLPHYHTVTFNNGQITIGGVTDTAPGPFDITATTWYKNQIAAERTKGQKDVTATLIGKASLDTGVSSSGSATEGNYYWAETRGRSPNVTSNAVYVPKFTVKKGSWNHGVISFTKDTTTGEPTNQTLTLTTSKTYSTDKKTCTVVVKDGNTTVFSEAVDCTPTTTVDHTPYAGSTSTNGTFTPPSGYTCFSSFKVTVDTGYTGLTVSGRTVTCDKSSTATSATISAGTVYVSESSTDAGYNTMSASIYLDGDYIGTATGNARVRSSQYKVVVPTANVSIGGSPQSVNLLPQTVLLTYTPPTPTYSTYTSGGYASWGYVENNTWNGVRWSVLYTKDNSSLADDPAYALASSSKRTWCKTTTGGATWTHYYTGYMYYKL